MRGGSNMDYLQLEKEVNNTMQVVNGWVNPSIPCWKYTFDYRKSKICAGERDGEITFYPIEMLNKIRLHPDNVVRANIVFITIHELSHIEQLIDYDRYMRDKQYCREIERGCNYHAFHFILDNLSILHQRLGDFDEMTIYGLGNSLGSYGIRYQLGTNWEMVTNLLHTYIQEKFLLSYRLYNYIEMIIKNEHPTERFGSCRVIVRNGNNVINVNEFLRVIDCIRDFNIVGFSNHDDNGKLIINLTLPADQFNPKEIVCRVNQ